MKRVFSTIRGRLLAMLLVAAIPLFAMAASIAWQNYRIVADQARQEAQVLVARLAARNASFVEEAERLLATMANSLPGQSPDSCGAYLKTVLDVQGSRYRGLTVFNAGGHTRCAAWRTDSGPLREHVRAVEAALLQTPPARSGVAIGGLPSATLPGVRALATGPASSSSDTPSLTVVARLPAERGLAGGAIGAGLAVDWLDPGDTAGLVPPTSSDGDNLAGEGRAWVQTEGGTLSPVAGAAAGQLPRDPALARLLSGKSSGLAATSVDGAPFAYAQTTLPGGLRLVVGLPASRDIRRAEQVLGRRLAELGALMLAGLASVALGANLSIVQPVKRLSIAVERWRAGGPFDARLSDGAPREIVAMAQSFSLATAALAEREHQLRDASTRQELLMQEIHHRVKNNLQIVASLLNLQAGRIRAPEAKAEFQAARDRIRALATLHRHLYAHGELHTINMRGFLDELCDQLLQALGETPDGGRIKLGIAAPELQLSSDQAVPIALIVTEAVSNSVKYAFPGGRSGHINVSLALSHTVALHGAGEGIAPSALLVIEDDGVGFSPGRAETAAGVRDGIGLQLIRGFARQLGATLEVTRERGTRYVVNIPLHRDRSSEPHEDPAPAAAA